MRPLNTIAKKEEFLCIVYLYIRFCYDVVYMCVMYIEFHCLCFYDFFSSDFENIPKVSNNFVFHFMFSII